MLLCVPDGQSHWDFDKTYKIFHNYHIILRTLCHSDQQVANSTCTRKCSNSALIGVSAVFILLVDILTIIIVIQCLLMARMRNPSSVSPRNTINSTNTQNDVPVTPNAAYELVTIEEKIKLWNEIAAWINLHRNKLTVHACLDIGFE